MGVAQPRKGLDILLDAFVREFGGDPGVRLVVKSANWGRLGGYRRSFPSPNIVWHDETVPGSDLLRYFEMSDCMVVPSRGEAFCLPGLEAMATGLPLIIHEWGGMSDYAPPELAYHVPTSRVVPAVIPWHGWTSPPLYGEINRDRLQATMREVYEDPNAARIRGLQGAEHVRRDWTWNRRTEIAVERVEEITGWQIKQE
jgi:glycosyltransferase involved in cell wall biosynthesis